MSRCQYSYEDYDYSSNRVIHYPCEEEAQFDSDFCIFHDGRHYEKNKSKIKEKFETKLKESMTENKPLHCMGYNLPEIEINGTINHPFLLMRAIFRGTVKFNVNFTENASAQFDSAIFKEEVHFSGTFDCYVSFFNAEFNKDARFNLTFKKESTFSNSKFKQKTDFYCIFDGDADFSVAVFYKDTYVSFSAIFNKRSNFWSTKFNGDTLFNYAIFNEASFQHTDFNIVSFSGCKFNGHADFYHANFNSKSDFSQVSFESTYFKSATFKENSDFSSSIFKGEADFSESKFLTSGCTFSSSNFEGTVSFRKTIFKTKVSFEYCNFKSNTDYSYCEFKTKTDFSFTNFTETDFNLTHFGNVYFLGTRFQKAKFIKTQFDGPAIFRLSKFDEVYFLGPSDFNDEVDFGGARFAQIFFHEITFHKTASFYQTVFEELSISESQFKDRTDFKFTRFENGEKCLFDVYDLSNVSFLNTDISKVRFSEKVSWGEDGFKVIDETDLENDIAKEVFKPIIQLTNMLIISVKEDRFGALLKNLGLDTQDKLDFKFADEKNVHIRDENAKVQLLICFNEEYTKAELILKDKVIYRFLVKKNKNDINLYESNLLTLDAVKAIYRNLRENYEFSFRYEQADEFYKREMELRRTYREEKSANINFLVRNDWLRRNFSLTGLYYHISRYGQNYSRPATIALGFIIFQIFYSLWQSNETLQFDAGFESSLKLENATLESLSKITGINSTSLVDFVVRASVIPVLGMLFIAAIKRSFEKRNRR